MGKVIAISGLAKYPRTSGARTTSLRMSETNGKALRRDGRDIERLPEELKWLFIVSVYQRAVIGFC